MANTSIRCINNAAAQATIKTCTHWKSSSKELCTRILASTDPLLFPLVFTPMLESCKEVGHGCSSVCPSVHPPTHWQRETLKTEQNEKLGKWKPSQARPENHSEKSQGGADPPGPNASDLVVPFLPAPEPPPPVLVPWTASGALGLSAGEAPPP